MRAAFNITAPRRFTEAARPTESVRFSLLMQLQIEQWPVDRLIPYIRNARTHSDAQVAQVAGSIASSGS